MMQNSKRFLLLNGHLYPADAPVLRADDAGFLHAYGAFETVRTRGGRVVGWRRHHARLRATLQRLAILADLEPVHGQILELLARNGIEGEGRVRVTVTAGVEGQPTVLVQAEPLPARVVRKRAGVKLRRLPVPRGQPDIKGLDWMGPRLALRRCASDEEPLRCVDGLVLEGATSNIFCATPEGVITPPLDGRLLPGTARAVLLEVLDHLGLPAREAPLPLHTLARHGGVVTNALLGLAPIVAVDGQAVGAPAWIAAAREVFDAVAD